VPFEESDDYSTWFIDQNYIIAMRGMFRKVNGLVFFLSQLRHNFPKASEVIVGWYSTGPKILPDDLAIHQV